MTRLCRTCCIAPSCEKKYEPDTRNNRDCNRPVLSERINLSKGFADLWRRRIEVWG